MALSPCVHCGKLNRATATSTQAPVCGSCKKALSIKNGMNEFTAANLAFVLSKTSYPVLVDFWAPWCGPCKSFAPTYQQASLELGNEMIFAKVDTEANPEVSEPHKIRSIPTLILFQNTKELVRQSGAFPLPALLAWIRAHYKKAA